MRRYSPISQFCVLYECIKCVSVLQDMMGADRQSEVLLMLKQSQKELCWIQKQLSLIANRSNGPVRTNEKVKVTVHHHTPNPYRLQGTIHSRQSPVMSGGVGGVYRMLLMAYLTIPSN